MNKQGKNNSFYGKKHTFISKEKMRLAHQGMKKPWIAKLFKGRIPWNKGKTKTEFPQLSNSGTRIGIIPYNKGKKMPEISGENHYLWVKDRTLLKDDHHDRGGQLHREWSKSVKNRDDWKCKINNKNCDGKLVAHHILSWKDYPELRYKINNGITVCHFHHPRKRDDEIKLIQTFTGLVMQTN